MCYAHIVALSFRLAFATHLRNRPRHQGFGTVVALLRRATTLRRLPISSFVGCRQTTHPTPMPESDPTVLRSLPHRGKPLPFSVCYADRGRERGNEVCYAHIVALSFRLAFATHLRNRPRHQGFGTVVALLRRATTLRRLPSSSFVGSWQMTHPTPMPGSDPPVLRSLPRHALHRRRQRRLPHHPPYSYSYP